MNLPEGALMPASRTTPTNVERFTLSSMVSNIYRNIPVVLQSSRAARFTAMGLGGVIIYLIIGQLIDPGFTNYWWYQLFQTSATLAVVLSLDALFVEEGGMAWQTHLLVVGATLADTLGTAGHLYEKVVPYDKFVHFAGGAALAAGAFQSLTFLDRRGVMAMSPFKRAFVSALISLLIAGVIWETYEYLSDVVFGSGRVHGWGDTIGDLIADTLGAITAVTIMVRHESANPHLTDEQTQELHALGTGEGTGNDLVLERFQSHAAEKHQIPR
jgi:hypothetical protein